MYYSKGFRIGLLIGGAVVLVLTYFGEPVAVVGATVATVLGGLATFIAMLDIPVHLALLGLAAFLFGWYSGVNWTERKRATFDGEDAMARRSRHRGIERNLPKRPSPDERPRENL